MTIAIIIDDKEDELQSSLSILKVTEKFEAVYGFNCPEAASIFIKERGCDVLFMETEIEGMNCFLLIDKLKKFRQDIFYVLMSSDENYALEAFQKGVMDYVLKPLTTESVLKSLEKLRPLLYPW